MRKKEYIITVVCMVLFIVSIIFLTYAILYTNSPIRTKTFFIVGLFIIVWAIINGIIVYPKGIIFEADRVIIALRYKSIRLKKEDIVKVEKISKSDIQKSIRLWGSEGFMGYWGLFRNNKIGTYTIYAKELSNLIMVKTDKKTYVINGDDQVLSNFTELLK